MPRKEVIQHDYANLIVLPVVGSLCTAAYFQVLPYAVPMATMLAYIIVDFVWIAAVPTCVPKAPLILTHHVFTAVLLLVALSDLGRFGYYGQCAAASIPSAEWCLLHIDDAPSCLSHGVTHRRHCRSPGWHG